MLFRPSLVALAVAAAISSFHASAQSVSSRVSGSIVENTVTLAGSDSATGGNPIYGDAYTGGQFFSRSFYFGDLDTGTTNLRMLAGGLVLLGVAARRRRPRPTPSPH